MARDRITASTKDLISDGGSVLLSIVKGEAFEFPVILDFAAVADSTYLYEAVIVEGLNDTLGSKPKVIQPLGIQDILVVRTCTQQGDWDALTAYDQEDVVLYTDGKYYKLLYGASRISAVTPDVDPLWSVHANNTLYIQFSPNLSSSYTVQPTADTPVYGFFELRVTEVSDPIFVNTWKPVRGLIEFLFSPTDIV